MKIAIVASKFNATIVENLVHGALQALEEGGVAKEDIKIVHVPGAFEIPFVAQKLADTKKYAGIIALGCVLEGQTDHYKAVCDGVTYGIQKVSLESRLPVMFGVLMCRKFGHAQERSMKNTRQNKGYECGKGLLEILGLML